jgi:DNA-binding transcriptional regulator YdaS (Cro superfamily)
MLTENDMRNILRHRCASAGSAAAFAQQANLSEGLVSQILSGRQKVGPKMAKALGYRKIIRFEPLQSNSDVK